MIKRLNDDYEPLVGDDQGLDYLQKRRDEAVALLKLLSFSVEDSKNNRVMSSASFKKRLANRKLEA